MFNYIFTQLYTNIYNYLLFSICEVNNEIFR
jgi:hypothetical protein